MPSNKLFQIALVVDDYDEALDFYIHKLQFKLIEDTIINEEKRWVVVAPDPTSGCHLLLAKASNEEQKSRVGNQTGGRVFLFMYTDDFESYHKILLKNNIKIFNGPRNEIYGRVLVFEDLYGNKWDLIQPVNL